MKVLIAEDDSVSALALRMLLERNGHEVNVTTNGRAAWDTLQTQHYPLVILDWMMPEMDGLAVCRKIRSTPGASYTCIIMLTAKQAREDRLEALNSGVDVFLTKPLDSEDMLARLQVAERILALER